MPYPETLVGELAPEVSLNYRQLLRSVSVHQLRNGQTDYVELVTEVVLSIKKSASNVKLLFDEACPLLASRAPKIFNLSPVLNRIV